MMIISQKIKLIEDAIISKYLEDNIPWFLAYSGGKDSTSVLMLTYNAIKRIRNYHKKITIIYCDTGVETPCVRNYTLECLQKLQKEIEKDKSPFEIKIVFPEIDERFFSMVLGKGYVPPTFLFRWCTNRMRINPVQKIVGKQSNLILLGTRKFESIERTRTLEKHLIQDGYFRQKNYPLSILYSPIVDFDTSNVWECIDFYEYPKSINKEKLKFLYFSNAKLLIGTKEGGRFGCWICTVVRKDKAGLQLLNKGFTEMKQLMDYRNLLIDTRNNPQNRLPNRKTGDLGKGPYKVEVRKMLFHRLMKMQSSLNIELIEEKEIQFIKKCWEQ